MARGNLETTKAVASTRHDDFDEALYRALYAMAEKSPRYQADVQAAMRQAGLTARPTALAAALQRLENAGRVSKPIPLLDGGMLITVAV
jgi:hypothetical protein